MNTFIPPDLGNGILFEPFSFQQIIRVYEGADS